MNELIPYLKDVASLECQLYTQDRLLNQLYQKASALGNPVRYKKPDLKSWHPDFLVTLYVSCCGSFWITIIVSMIAILMGYGYGNWGDFFRFAVRSFPIIFILVAIIWIIFFDRREYCSLKKKYEKDILQYNSAVKADACRVNDELAVRRKLVEQWDKVKAERDKTKNALDAVYQMGIIHPKYRNMVAVTSFFDYFDTGRCFSLTGPGGAYATYEEDLRFKRIETRLDVVISKLDEIVANQQYMAELMREANATLSRIEASNNSMMKDVKKIKDNSELTAYNTQCSAQSDNVMEHIMLYQTIQWS